MILNNRKLVYISFHRPESKGVSNKIKGIIKELKSFGYDVDLVNPHNCKSITSYFNEVRLILRSDARFIVFRTLNTTNIFLSIIFFVARLQGRFLIMDVPTPMKSYIHELLMEDCIKWKKYIYILLCYLHGPWFFWIFNRVIQYGNESAFFRLGNKNRFLLVGNGIDVDSIRIREKKYKWPSSEVVLVGVAQVRFYHGFDRIIKAINYWNNTEEGKKNSIIFHIIGGGDKICIDELKMLVSKFNLEKFVYFHGSQSLGYIHNYYSKAHFAVSSLGLYRLKLKDASVLKAREYCAAGIPFIAAGEDPDFKNDIFFRLTVSNDHCIDDIVSLFRSLPSKIGIFKSEEIRNYAYNNWTFKVKLQQMGFVNFKQLYNDDEKS